MYILLSESKQSIQHYSASGVIGDVAFNDDNILKGSLSVNNQSSASNKFSLGGVYIGEMSVSFINIDIPRNEWIGKEIRLYITIGETVIPVGVFTIDNATHSGGITSVTAYDNMTKFDKMIGTEEGTNGSAYNLLAMACAACNVTLGMTQAQIEEFPNGNLPFVLLEMGDIETWRDFIYWISVSLCCFATIDRNGNLVLRRFGNSVVDSIDYNVRYSSSSYSDEVVTYTGATVYSTEDKVLEYYHAATDNGYTLEIGSNPFFQVPKAQREQYMSNVVAGLGEIAYNSCSVKIPFGFHYDLGDVLQFPHGQGSNSNLFCVMGFSFKYNGECLLRGIANHKDSKSKTDKNLQGMINAIGKSEFTSYELREPSATKIIADGETERLLEARIASNTNTKAQIHIEVNLESEAVSEDYTQGIISYLINSEDAQFYPTETWFDGKHVLHLMYILPVEANTIQIFSVYLESIGGNIKIERNGIWLYASGAGLVGDGKWDGSVSVHDEAEPFVIAHIRFADADDSVVVNLISPISASGSDVATAWSLADMQFESVADSVIIVSHSDSVMFVTENEESLLTEDGFVFYTEGE